MQLPQHLVILFLSILPCYANSTSENPFSESEYFDDYVDKGARILVVGAHPDDESLAGPLLAHACIQKQNTCHIAIFTRGGGGTCGLFFKGCKPNLATVRTREMEKVAERYGASLDLGDFYNLPSKFAQQELSYDAIRANWEAKGDPRRWLHSVINRFQPDVLVTLDPSHGFTGNKEHQLASVLVNQVIHPKSGTPPGPKHLTVFHIINRYPILKPLLGNDPVNPTQQWQLNRMCGKQTCAQVAMDIAWEHRSQLAVSALLLFVLFADNFESLYLRKLPVRPVPDQFLPHSAPIQR